MIRRILSIIIVFFYCSILATIFYCSVCSIVVFFIYRSYLSFQDCNDLELKIKEMCVETDSVYTTPLASLTSFEWEVLYVISGPTVDNEVEELIGISYEEVIQDGERQYIFINDDQIVKEYSSHCDINLSKHPAYAIGQKYSNTSLIQVEKKKIKGEVYYQVEEIKN